MEHVESVAVAVALLGWTEGTVQTDLLANIHRPFCRSSAGNVRKGRARSDATCPVRSARRARAHVVAIGLDPRSPCSFHSLIIMDDRERKMDGRMDGARRRFQFFGNADK